MKKMSLSFILLMISVIIFFVYLIFKIKETLYLSLIFLGLAGVMFGIEIDPDDKERRRMKGYKD